MPDDLWAARAAYFYRVEYGWPGLPSQTKLVDLGRTITVGAQVKVDDLWWRVERVELPAVGERHLGRVTATPAD